MDTITRIKDRRAERVAERAEQIERLGQLRQALTQTEANIYWLNGAIAVMDELVAVAGEQTQNPPAPDDDAKG